MNGSVYYSKSNSILSLDLPICRLEGISSTDQGFNWGQSEWSTQTNIGASLISFGFNVVSFEIKRDLLDDIVNRPFPIGIITSKVMQNALDNICENISTLDSFLVMPSLTILSSIRTFTRDDIAIPQYDGVIGHIASGYDLDGNGSRDNYYMVSPHLLGFPIIVMDCDVTFQNTGESTADYFVEVTNIPNGWYVGTTDDGFNNPGDHKYDISGVSPSSWTGTKWVVTPWQIGVKNDAPDEASITFSLYHDTLFNTLLNRKEITFRKFKGKLEQALTIKGTNGSYNIGGFAQYLTREPGEPDHAGVKGTGSVWMKWIAPNDGKVIFDTSECDYDTLLAVYTGTDLGNLVNVASNNNYGAYTYSQVEFKAKANTEYYIVIDTNEVLGTTIDDMVRPHINYQYIVH